MIREFSKDHATSNRDKVKNYKWIQRGERGELAWIDKELLKIDDSYQRLPSKSKVKKIASDWSWIGCGVIICNKRNNDILVVDGQHRVMAAMKRSDIKELPCIVFEVSNAKEESDGFLDTNTNRMPLKTQEKYKAMIVSGVPAAVKANALLNKLGIKVVFHGKGGSSGTQAIGTILQMIEKNEKKAAEVVELAHELCEAENLPISQILLDGLFVLDIKLEKSIMDEALRKRIKKIGASALEMAAKRAAAFFTKGGGYVWADGMIEQINKGLRGRFKKKGE